MLNVTKPKKVTIDSRNAKCAKERKVLSMTTQLIHRISHIHQIMIVEGGEIPDTLPQMINNNIESVKRIYPRARYYLWGGRELREFISENFSSEVLHVYDNLTPYAYKADLARYCLLSVYGGMYVDLGIRIMNSWDIPLRKGIAAFRDVPFVTASWTTMQNGLLWSLPRREEFDLVIARIVANFNDKYYGLNPLYPTGPVLLGKSFAQAMLDKGRSMEADDQHIGNCRCITPDDHMLNVSYVSKEGRLIALRTKSGGGDLSHIGLYGTNNYNLLWKSRRIYNEPVQTWLANNSTLELEGIARLTNEGIGVDLGKTGRITFGPFFPLEPGKYTLTAHFSDGTKCNNFRLDLCDSFGTNVLSEKESRIDGTSFALTFTNHEFRENTEFRTYALEAFEGTIQKITLEKDHTYEVPSGDRATMEWQWRHDSEEIKLINVSRTPDGIAVKRGTRGRITYGPYIKLFPGRYRINCLFSDDTYMRRISLDIGGGKEGQTLMVKKIENKNVSKKNSIDIEFSLDDEMENVEFRLSVDKYFHGKIIEFNLSKDSV